jgi:hypothetical protein
VAAVTAAATVVAAGATAYGAYSSSKAQKDAARRAASPQQTSQTSEPWAPSVPYLEEILRESQTQYQQPHKLPTYTGGGGASSQTREILDRMMAGPQVPTRTSTGALDQYATGQLGGDTNPYRQSLAAALGNVGDERSGNRDLVMQLLGGGSLGGGGGAPPAESAPGSPAATTSWRYQAGAARPGGGAAGGGGGGGGGGQGYGGLFTDQVRRFFDSANEWSPDDPLVRSALDLMQSEADEDFGANRAALESRVAAGGRLGSAAHAAGLGSIADELGEALNQGRSSFLLGDKNAAQQRALEALGYLGTAEGNILAANTSRANAASAAGASRANTEAALALERELGLRGQDIQALSLLFGSEENAIGALSEAAGQLDSSRSVAGQLALGLGEYDLGRGGLDLDYLTGAAGVSGGIDQRRGAAANARYQAELNQYNEQGRQLDDYWRRTLGIAGLGGSSQGVVPGQYVAGPSTPSWLTGLNAGLGTASSLAGLWQNAGGGASQAAGVSAPAMPTTPQTWIV